MKPEQAWIEINGTCLHVVQAGPEEGPLVILLHGFPEFWFGWRHQLPALAAAGYRVWAPDQRGYNLSAKPASLDAYSVDTLARDVVGLIDAAGRDRAFLVGHDWGASIAWWVATRYPDQIDRMVVINVPHWAIFREHMRRNVRQVLRSWYILFFQIPWLPEAFARLGDWAMPARALRQSSLPGTFTDADLDEYRKAWSQPGAYTAMLNWYRAVVQKPPAFPMDPRITVPTLLIWGAKDPFLGSEMARPSIELCDQGRLVFLEGATHWVQHEKASEVNELIVRFFRRAADRE